MNYYGNRLYYDKKTGEIFFQTGEIMTMFDIPESTIDDDVNKYYVLSERNRDTFDVIELEYGQYAQDFAECNGYRINVDTKQIEFSYPDTNETEPSEPVYQAPLSEQIADNAAHLLDVDFRLMVIELSSI